MIFRTNMMRGLYAVCCCMRFCCEKLHFHKLLMKSCNLHNISVIRKIYKGG